MSVTKEKAPYFLAGAGATEEKYHCNIIIPCHQIPRNRLPLIGGGSQ